LQLDEDNELEGYRLCCVEAVGLCKEFYKVRPVNDGSLYDPPTRCKRNLFL